MRVPFSFQNSQIYQPKILNIIEIKYKLSVIYEQKL